MPYILAHDFGTTADKASLFTTEGRLVSTRTASYPTYYAPGNQAEQDANDWWRVFCENNEYLLQDIPASEVVCVSFDGTSPNCLCVDRDGQPLHRAMIWQDTRAVTEAMELSAALPERFLHSHPQKCISPDRSLPKILWMKKNRPDILKRTWKILPCVTNYIILRLTGLAVCDYGVGRTTAAMTPDNTDWADEPLSYAGISRDMMPDLLDRASVAGHVPEGMESICGLAAGTAVVTGTIDNACASIGAGILKAGDVFICSGTSTSIEGLDNNGNRIGRPTTASGASLNWLRDELCLPESQEAVQNGRYPMDVIMEKAALSPVGSNGVFFHPYMAGARSVLNDPHAKGAFFGLNLNTTRNDLMRAVVEGIGFNLDLILQMIRSSGMTVTRMPIVGGLGKSAFVCQVFADIMNVEICTFEYMDEAATIGAAVLGGMALGLYESESAVNRFMHVTSVTAPNPANHKKYAALAPLFRELYEAMRPLYPRMDGVDSF